MLSNVVGLPPETLNSLQKVSTALNGDPNFFTTVNGKFDNKQNKISNGTLITGSKSLLNTTTSKLKNIVGSNLSLTEDDNNLTITAVDAYNKDEITTKIQTINTDINKKQNTLSNGTLITNSKSLLNTTTSKLKNIVGVNHLQKTIII
jgi:hypothetical protein